MTGIRAPDDQPTVLPSSFTFFSFRCLIREPLDAARGTNLSGVNLFFFLTSMVPYLDDPFRPAQGSTVSPYTYCYRSTSNRNTLGLLMATYSI